MSKFALVVALAILAIVQGNPQRQSEIADAASRGDWDLVHSLIQQKFKSQSSSLWQPSESAGSVRSLTPPPGGHVYGESVYSYRSSSNDNGKKTENKGGHRVVNKDGVISEYDVEPTF